MRIKVFASLLATLLWLSTFCGAQAQLVQAGQPRLVLMLVVDQFSYDLLSRFNGKFTGGFRYLQDHGATFTNCRYKHATTTTADGHATIATGAYPWAHGVVGDAWLMGSKGVQFSVFDDSVQLVGANGQGASAKAMKGTTFGDSLKLATNGRSKVFAVSLKDRGALFLAGKLGNGAYWFDPRTGNMVSSSQFGGTLPGWVSRFNEKHYPDQYFGKAWQKLLPEAEYSSSSHDDASYEGQPPGDGRSFPHVLTGGATIANQVFFETFQISPFANQMLADLAKDAIEGESLGSHTDPDVLAISFSATDFVGHMFGPNSQEAQDTIVRLDQTIGGLLKYIDGKVGLNRTLVIVTGDHGASPVPEFLRERGQNRGIEAGRIDPKSFELSLDAALDQRLGPDDWITDFIPPNLYLNLAAIDKNKYRQPEVEALAAKLAHSITGVGDAFTANELFTGQVPNSPYEAAVRRSYYWGRSGELYVIPRPGYIFMGGQSGTTHGSPYAYDQQVPLILAGGPITNGKFGQAASPADIAPTVCSILNVPQPPISEGRVLQEALLQVQGPPAPLP